MKSARMLFLAVLFITSAALSQNPVADTTIVFEPSQPDLIRQNAYYNPLDAWGFDIMLSNNGFGAGGFYRHEFSEEFSGMITLALSDVKDDAEVEYFDYFGNSFIPGKKNRLIMIPLMAAVQLRLFKEDIMDNFRPYLSAGVGPTMMFVAPYSYSRTVSDSTIGTFQVNEDVEFFESLKFGQAKYTIGGYLSAGAYFGAPYGTLMGLSIRYYFVPFPSGIEVMDGVRVKNFGGFYITLNIGSF
jgi:hypothetical protein